MFVFFFFYPPFQSAFSTSRFGLTPQNSLPAKALEIRSFFHSQGWSYSSGGRSSSWGSRLSLGQFKRSGSDSPPFSAGSYGVSYSGSCFKDPSLAPRLPDRISAQRWRDKSVMSLPWRCNVKVGIEQLILTTLFYEWLHFCDFLFIFHNWLCSREMCNNSNGCR